MIQKIKAEVFSQTEVGCNQKKMKEFKILNFQLTKDDFIGLETIITELSEIQRMEIPGISYAPQRYRSKGDIYIFSPKSDTGKRIINNPEVILELDLNNFEEGEIDLPNGRSNAFYHLEYLIEKKNISTQNSKPQNDEINEWINECLLYHHTDMFFTYLYRYIIYEEYESEGKNKAFDLEEILVKFNKLCSYILMEACNIKTPYFESLDNNDFFIYANQYQKTVEYAKAYKNVISTYVIYRDSLREIIELSSNFNDPTYSIFYQKCMIKGYEIAKDRIESNLKNKEYYKHELIKTKNMEVIKIFPTPFGFKKRDTLVDLATSGKIDESLDNYMEKHNFKRVTNDAIHKRLSTKYVFKRIDEESIYYFKRREQNGEYAPFGEQNRESPIHSLLVQGQINLTKEK